MRIKLSVTSANLIALLALFVAIGGSAYAFHLGKNAVKTTNIKDGAVTEAKIANAAISASKLATGAVKTPSVVVRYAYKPLNDNSNAIPEADCQPGEVAVGGGGQAQNQASDIQFHDLTPTNGSGGSVPQGGVPRGFDVNYLNLAGGAGSTTAAAYVLCMSMK